MAQITIDGKEYDSDALSPEARAQISNLAATDRRLAELQRDLAITQTARSAYAKALSEQLPKA